jgi:hypothetical protein
MTSCFGWTTTRCYAWRRSLPRFLLPSGPFPRRRECSMRCVSMPRPPSRAMKTRVPPCATCCVMAATSPRVAANPPPSTSYAPLAATDGALGSINAAVDACNAVSLHSGFPISVVDLDRASAPFRIAIAPAGASYVFNASGQEIDLSGLLCLHDAAGPCANAVRDAQRTKTSADTRSTLSVIWGCAGFEARLTQAEDWYRALLAQVGAATERVDPRGDARAG